MLTDAEEEKRETEKQDRDGVSTFLRSTRFMPSYFKDKREKLDEELKSLQAQRKECQKAINAYKDLRSCEEGRKVINGEVSDINAKLRQLQGNSKAKKNAISTEVKQFARSAVVDEIDWASGFHGRKAVMEDNVREMQEELKDK